MRITRICALVTLVCCSDSLRVPRDATCTIIDNQDGSATIQCPDGAVTVDPRPQAGSCTVTDNGDGTKTIACDDGTTVTIRDGTDGSDGSDGNDGGSCSVADNGDGTKTIRCDDGTEVTLTDGEPGPSCSVTSQCDAIITVTCTDGTTVTWNPRGEVLLQSVTPGSLHTCALLGDVAKCWGYNESGRLGQGDTADRGDEPGEMARALGCVDLGTAESVSFMTAGAGHTCALLSRGAIKCWGRNTYGELGLGDTDTRGDEAGEMGDHLLEINLGGNATAASIATGGGHNCILFHDGTLKCWGANWIGQLGLGDENSRGDEPGEMGVSLPFVDVGTGRSVVQVTAGFAHTCALLDDASIKCWGRNTFGGLGLGDAAHRGDDPNEMGDALPAVDLGSGRTAVQVAAGEDHTCAILDDRTIKCWGRNSAGEIGIGLRTNQGDTAGEMGDNLPAIDLGVVDEPIGLALGESHSCALFEGGNVKCWGRGREGQHGLGLSDNWGDEPGEMGAALPFVNLGTEAVVTALVSHWNHTCAILSDRTFKCWGHNRFGRLGLGDTLHRGDAPGEMGDDRPTVDLGL